MSAIEKVHRIRVAPAADNTVLLACDGEEDTKIVLDMPQETARRLTADLIAAGFGPQRSGRA